MVLQPLHRCQGHQREKEKVVSLDEKGKAKEKDVDPLPKREVPNQGHKLWWINDVSGVDHLTICLLPALSHPLPRRDHLQHLRHHLRRSTRSMVLDWWSVTSPRMTLLSRSHVLVAKDVLEFKTVERAVWWSDITSSWSTSTTCMAVEFLLTCFAFLLPTRPLDLVATLQGDLIGHAGSLFGLKVSMDSWSASWWMEAHLCWLDDLYFKPFVSKSTTTPHNNRWWDHRGATLSVGSEVNICYVWMMVLVAETVKMIPFASTMWPTTPWQSAPTMRTWIPT